MMYDEYHIIINFKFRKICELSCMMNIGNILTNNFTRALFIPVYQLKLPEQM